MQISINDSFKCECYVQLDHLDHFLSMDLNA